MAKAYFVRLSEPFLESSNAFALSEEVSFIKGIIP
jgi:hypothetical protein